MNFRDTIGYEGEEIPSADTAPAVTHSLMQLAKAAVSRIGTVTSGGPTVHSQLSSILANISGGLERRHRGLGRHLHRGRRRRRCRRGLLRHAGGPVDMR